MKTVFPTRPRTVTITLWGVFLLGMWNAGRVIALSQQNRILLELSVKPDPRLRLVIALIWTILFWGSAVGLWRKRPFTQRAIPILLLLYTIYELSLLFIFAQAPAAQRNGVLNTIFYVSMIVFSQWALHRSANKSYFAKPYESENQTTT